MLKMKGTSCTWFNKNNNNTVFCKYFFEAYTCIVFSSFEIRPSNKVIHGFKKLFKTL